MYLKGGAHTQQCTRILNTVQNNIIRLAAIPTDILFIEACAHFSYSLLLGKSHGKLSGKHEESIATEFLT